MACICDRWKHQTQELQNNNWNLLLLHLDTCGKRGISEAWLQVLSWSQHPDFIETVKWINKKIDEKQYFTDSTTLRLF